VGAKAVIFKLIGDSKSAENAFKRVQRQAEESGKFIDKLRAKAVDMGSAFGPAGASIAEAVTSPQAAVAAAGAAIGKFVTDGVAGFVRLASATKDVQRATGATAEEASGFLAIADDYNISTETLSGSLFKLARGIGDGTANLSQFGVSAVRAADGSVDLTATVGNIADAYNRMSDPAQRATLLAEAFGRNGKALVPILEQGAAGIRSLFAEAENTNQILSDEDVQKGEEYRLAIDALQDAFQGLQRESAEKLVPALTDMVAALTKIVELGDKVSTPLSWLGKLNNAVTALADKLPGINHNLNAWQIFTTSAGDSASDATPKVADLTDEIEEQAPAADKLRSLLEQVADATGRVSKAQEGVADAGKRLKDAQADLAELLRTGKDGLTDYEEALKRVEDADRKVADSESSVADARRDVDDATRKVADATEDVADAERDLVRAHERVEEAQERVLKVEQNIADLRAEAAEDAKDATLDIAKGENDHKKALDRLAKAQAKLDQLRQGAETTAAGLAEAEQEVADARLDVNETARDLEKSHKDLDQATATLNGTSDEAKQAEKDRRAAVEDLNTALGNEATAQQTLINAKADVVTAENDKATAVGNLVTAEKNLATAIGERNTKQAEAAVLDDTDVKFAEQVKEARDKVAGAERGVRDAKRETATAIGDQILKQQELDNLINTSSISAVRNLKNEYDNLIKAHPELAAVLGPALNVLNTAVQSAASSVNPALNPRAAGPVLPGQQRARAAGGPVWPGDDFLVGENGPEVVRFPRSGRVIPNDQLGAAGGGTVINNVTVHSNASPEEIAAAIAWKMRTSGY
jgi:chromosome segregation ATPase